MSCILNLFLFMDSFGARPSFYINGDKEYHTLFGGILTTAVYLITVGYGIYFAQELWQRNDPTVSTATLITQHPEKILYPDPFFFMVSVDMGFAPKIDESIYFPTGNIHITHVNDSGTFSERNFFYMKKCSEVIDKNYVHYDLLKDYDLDNFYCMPKFDKKENDLYLNDYWGNDGFAMLQVKIYTCGIYNDASSCKSSSEIETALSGATLSYYTINQFVDTHNFSYPFVNGLQEHYLYLSTEKLSKFTAYMRHISVETDEGFILSFIRKKEGLTVDSYSDSQNREDAKNGYIFGLTIQLTNIIDCYKRSYYKLQNLFEDMSAVYGVLMIIVLFIEQYYNESRLSIDMINSFFEIKDENEENEKNIVQKNKSAISLPRIHKDDASSNCTKAFVSSSRRITFIKKRRKRINEEKATTEESNIHNCNKGKRFSVDFRKKSSHLVPTTKLSSSNIIDSKYLTKSDNKNQTQTITQKKLEFNFYQKLICLNCCESCRHCGNKKKDYDMYERGMKYISELLEIKNIMKKICIDNMKYSLDYNELRRQKMEEMSVPILSLDQTGKNVPLSYFEGNTEHEKIGEVVDVGRDLNRT